MKFTTRSYTDYIDPCDLMILPLFEGQKWETEFKNFEVLHGTKDTIARAMTLGDFGGKKQEKLVLHTGHADHPRIMLLGLGKEKDYSVRRLRECVGAALVTGQGKKWKRVSFVVTIGLRKKEELGVLGSLLVRSAEISTYAYDEHKTDPEVKKVALETIQWIVPIERKEKKVFEKGLVHGTVIAAGVNFTRHLGNTPPTIMTPEYLGHAALGLSKQNKGLTVKVLGKKEIEKLKMGCLLGVGQGSIHEPKFIIAEYWGGKKSEKPTVLVGKGITFDSGGLSIKPGNWMTEMKFDMLGAAAVLGAIKVAADLKLKKNIVALVPTAENMPSGSAFRPDDVLTAMNGKTVEIVNTDAEGRLILADALCYAKQYDPLEVIDLATLTGACMGALGTERSGIFTTDERVCRDLITSGEASGEQLWRLPLGEEYTDANKSEIADIKNMSGVGSPGFGGASTAAAFLQFFTDYTWAHIDLASAIFMSKSKPYLHPGANGFGVETLVAYLSRKD